MGLFRFFYYLCNEECIFFEKMLGHKPLPAIFFEKIDNFAKHFLSYTQEKESVKTPSFVMVAMATIISKFSDLPCR